MILRDNLTFFQLRRRLKRFASPKKKRVLTSFFKCRPGEYGAGDCFIGVPIPQIRSLIPLSSSLSLLEISALLKSRVHEERLLALLILVDRYQRGNTAIQNKIFNFYIKHKKFVNNWDLVDLSAYHIVGNFLFLKPRRLLFRLAASNTLWDRRIAVVATLFFIRQGDLKTTFDLCERLMRDKEDLMHKACGWMLREAGKKNVGALKVFLKKHAPQMPRTMLRYAIEKFPEKQRRAYLGRKVRARLGAAQS